MMWIYVAAAGFFKSIFSAILNHFQYGKDDQPSNLRVAHRPTKIPCRTGAKVSWAIKTCKETGRSSQKIDGHWTERVCLKMDEHDPKQHPNNHITREKDDKPLKNMGDQWGPYFKTNPY